MFSEPPSPVGWSVGRSVGWLKLVLEPKKALKLIFFYPQHIICFGKHFWCTFRFYHHKNHKNHKNHTNQLININLKPCFLAFQKYIICRYNQYSNKNNICFGWGWTASASNPQSPGVGRLVWDYSYLLWIGVSHEKYELCVFKLITRFRFTIQKDHTKTPYENTARLISFNWGDKIISSDHFPNVHVKDIHNKPRDWARNTLSIRMNN